MTQTLGVSNRTADESVETINIVKDVVIEAPPDFVFESILEEAGPGMKQPDGVSLGMRIEAWPGGRWFRDLGDKVGHLWGHVQVIKPSKLLELCGPMFMSYPAINHVQYKLIPEGKSTRLKFSHRAIGLIPAEHAAGVSEGWGMLVDNIKKAAERKAGK